MLTALVFYPTAIALIIFALLTVYLDKIVHSLVASIVVFFLVGLIFYLIGAEYNAVIQLSVYGLAVPILLAIALMFTNTRNEKPSITNGARRYMIYSGVILFILAVIYLIGISLNLINTETFAQSVQSQNSSLVFDAITNGFLNKYIVAFELISILLFAVVVGVSDNAK